MTTPNPHLERGQLLLSQGRFDLAERELRQAIGHDPNEAQAYSYLALCLAERQQWQPATEAAQRAVGLDPTGAYHHYTLASVYCDRDMPEEARAAINESLQLEPHDADYWAMRAQIDLSEKKFKDALTAAERGLEIDARHQACVNLRAVALTNLGQKSRASEAIDANLERNPMNAMSHANMGWTLLHQHKPHKALDHFREALRIQPGMEWARSGLVEALKVRNIIYRAFLAYFLFMGRLSGNVQWGIMIGGYLGYQVLRSVAKNNPSIAPYVSPLLAAYIVLVIGTIVTVPLFNLFLFLDRFGRHALTREQRWAALAFGLSLLPPVTFLVLWGLYGGDVYPAAALLMGVAVIPVSLAGGTREGTPRAVMISIAVAMWCIGAVLCTLLVAFDTVIPGSVMIYTFGCFGSTWISNMFATSRPPARY